MTPKVRVSASPSGALTLVNLATGRAQALRPGKPVTRDETFRLSVVGDRGNLLIERLAAGRLALDGTDVFALAHLRPGQIIATDGAAYVVLRPHDVFLRPDTDATGRLARWASLTTQTKATWLTTQSSPVETGTVVPAARSSAWHRTSPRRRRWLGAGGLCLGLAGLAVPTAQNVPAPAPPDAPVAPSPERHLPLTTSVFAPHPAPDPPETSPVPDPETATVPETRAEVGLETPTATPQSIPPRAFVPVDAALERHARDRLEALLLESNYDPHRVRREIRHLQGTVPKGSRLHRDLGHAARSIP